MLLDRNDKITKNFTEERLKENTLDLAQIKIENPHEIDKLSIRGE